VARNKSGVDPPLCKRGSKLMIVQLEETQRDARMLLSPPAQERLHFGGGGRHAKAEADFTCMTAPIRARSHLDGRQFTQRPPHLFDDRASTWRHVDTHACPFNKRQAEPIFNVRDAPGECRRADAELPRGARKASCLHDVDQVL
jgi:hypothetical protein